MSTVVAHCSSFTCDQEWELRGYVVYGDSGQSTSPENKGFVTDHPILSSPFHGWVDHLIGGQLSGGQYGVGQDLGQLDRQGPT